MARHKKPCKNFVSKSVKGFHAVTHVDENNLLWVYVDVSNTIIDGLEIGVDSALRELPCRWGMKYLGEGIPGYRRGKDKYWCGWRYKMDKLPEGIIVDDMVEQDVRGFVNRLNLLSKPWRV